MHSITKEDEFKVLAARGRGRFTVAICPGDLGRALVKALSRRAGHSAALFQARRWSALLGYRIAFGLATGSWGGKSLRTMAAPPRPGPGEGVGEG